MRIHLILIFGILLTGPFLSSTRAAEPPPEEEEPVFEKATAAEERRIKALIADLLLPPALARKKMELAAASQGRTLASEKAKEETDEDYQKRREEEAKKKVQEIKASIRSLAPSALPFIEKQAKELVDGFDPDLKEENLKNEVRFWTRQYNKLVSSEAPEHGKLPREERNKLLNARKEQKERQRAEQEAFWASFGEYMKKRRAAQKELTTFKSKAVPFLSKALGNAGWDDGTAMVEVLAPLRQDDRYHGAVLSWFDRQSFLERKAVPRVLGAVVKMNLPGIISHLQNALRRVPHMTKFLFLNPLYEASRVNRQNTGPAIDALTNYLKGADLLSAEAAVNILLRFAQGAHVQSHDKRRVIRTLGNVVRQASSSRTARVVAMGLGRTSSPDAVQVLRRLLSHRDKNVRMSAVVSLGSLGPLSAESAETIESYVEPSYSQRMRVAAMLALGKIGNLDSGEALINNLKDENKSIKMAAHRALVQMFERRVDKRYNPQAWLDVLGKLREERRRAEEEEEEEEEDEDEED